MTYEDKSGIQPQLRDALDSKKCTTIAAEATANGSDATTTQALANALKVKLNAVIAALKAADLMA